MYFLANIDSASPQHKDKVAQENRVSELLAAIQDRSAALLRLYDDADG